LWARISGKFAREGNPAMTTTVSPFSTLVPDTIECPSWCTVEHEYDPRTLASAGWIDHQHVIIDRLDLRVVVQQSDTFPHAARPGEPASPGQREPAVISVDVDHERGGAYDVQEISPQLALDLADALTRAALIITAAGRS
jgi:hypothetical protein